MKLLLGKFGKHYNFMEFNNIYNGKKVFITGNTGFKGSWLSTWLIHLGAKVYGYSKDVPTSPSMFDALQLKDKCDHTVGDIRDKVTLEKAILEAKPDFIFHLAAQSIVSTSYKEPLETISTNVVGTAVILDIIKDLDFECNCVIITSDKAYDNVEWIWGYRENDRMGGKDIYSGSKGAAELIINSYIESFISKKSNIKIATVRAGNVIGGGDWSADRIVVDCINAFNNNSIVELRSPSATRPWQHVLEPLSGYLVTGQFLFENKPINREVFNFGPSSEQIRTVFELSSELEKRWFGTTKSLIQVTDNIPFEEAKLLKLNCDKALAYLQWKATLDFNHILDFIVEWYKCYYTSPSEIYSLTIKQIEEYTQRANLLDINWTRKND